MRAVRELQKSLLAHVMANSDFRGRAVDRGMCNENDHDWITLVVPPLDMLRALPAGPICSLL